MGSCLAKPSVHEGHGTAPGAATAPSTSSFSSSGRGRTQNNNKAGRSQTKRRSEAHVLGGASTPSQSAGLSKAGGQGYHGPVPATIITPPSNDSQSGAGLLRAAGDAKEAAFRAAEARAQAQAQKGGVLSGKLKQQQGMSGQALRKAEQDAERQRRENETLVYD
ncbi:hypothetical protein BCR37DRAFT_395574 [Protomyces lactucae-debilis]|uniref:Uncharacterized protein n=1 Tax=Protomyces lactucae-debilis TaxID=2754530 RepID=A0A1Y2EV97_PROLT|nr:uncharacterized protein BCR37DRAFT_395574 [Protomyces lactucae-debilis]ORY75479.1 hypothetical protein BCR37DRAFT_395574 [Protomyces lactucae-debilis]